MDMTTDSDKPYWVAFNHINGIGAVRTGQLLKRFSTLQNAWESSKTDLQFAGISEKLADQIVYFRSKTNPQELTESILARNIKICIRKETEYPHRQIRLTRHRRHWYDGVVHLIAGEEITCLKESFPSPSMARPHSSTGR